MTHRQYLVLAILAALMVASAFGLGRWAENLNPDGIIPHTPVAQDAATGSEASAASSTSDGTPDATAPADSAEARSAFTFGASMGLLAAGLLYCVIAAGLLLQQRAKGLPVNRFIYSIAGLAAAGFALSYLIDDYFY